MTLSVTIESLVEEEVQRRISDVKEELKITKSKLTKSKNEIRDLKEDIVKYKEIADNVESFNFLKSSVNDSNIIDVLKSFKLKTSDIEFSSRHMYFDRAAVWMKAIIMFYPEKERALGLMKFFDIQMPDWAGNFRMPYDFTKEEIKYIVDHIEENSISNSCYLSDNMGFYCERMKSNMGSVKPRDSWSKGSIPWQYLLKNKYLLDDEIFNIVIEKMKKAKSHTEYLYAISTYQYVDDKKLARMMECLENNKNWYHPQKNFVEQNGGMCIRTFPNLARSFANKMSKEKSDSFYFGNYPLNMQVDFLTKQSKSDQLILIARMEIEKEDKLTLFEKFNLL